MSIVSNTLPRKRLSGNEVGKCFKRRHTITPSLILLYYMGLGAVSSSLLVNNMVSSWVGVTFVFTFATRKVFRNTGRIPLGWKYVVYLLYQCVLIYFVSKLLEMLNGIIISYVQMEFIVKWSSMIAKLLVTPVTMVLNFFVMKGIIERL